MKICVLQPDYANSSIDYQHYDPPRNLSHLLPNSTFDHVFINKLHTYQQLKELKKQHYDIFVNLCEGYLEWDIPSIDVVHSLELLNLPHTGPNAILYDPSKELMKYVAYTEGIATPAYAMVTNTQAIATTCNHLRFPLFVKPAKAGDSLGIDHQSLVVNESQLEEKVKLLLPIYEEVLIEEFIAGREFTVLVAATATADKTCTTFQPIEFIFPAGTAFKTYQLKTSELHPSANIPVNDQPLDERLRTAASRIFQSFNGVGYARLDFRMNSEGQLFFLEINFTCSVFYTNGYEGSADYILKYDGIGPAKFLQHIINEGIARHQLKQKKYCLKGNAINGFGIYAPVAIAAGTTIFEGETTMHRLVTRAHVQQYWNEADQLLFKRYAYPVSDEVYILWHTHPAAWAPQNHSCDANTAYEGLNVYALRDIAIGEELTLNYTHFLNEEAEPFLCQCKAPHCQGQINGQAKNSVTTREEKRHRSATTSISTT
jgi:D-alanine--D-alanine ligase